MIVSWVKPSSSRERRPLWCCKISKRHCLGLFFLLLVMLVQTGTPPCSWALSYRVAILQSIRHPALNDVAEGIRLYFLEQGINLDCTEFVLNEEQAGNSTGDYIAQIREFGPELVFTLGTQASQKALQELVSSRIVFSAVTDPVGAGLVRDMQKPGGRVTGLSDMSPVQEQLEMITWIHQDIDSLGIVFSEFEQNAVLIKNRMKAAADKSGLKLKTAAVKQGGDVEKAAIEILDRVDALYIPTDNYVVSHVKQLAQLCASKNIPLYAADPTSVAQGAMASLSIDYHRMGLQTGAMALRILQGEDPSAIPVEKPREVSITINIKSAERMNVDLPLDLVLAADTVHDYFP